MAELVNRVAQSGLITLDLEDFYPAGEVIGFDLKQFLFRELILREKDFREALKAHDWTQYDGQVLAIHCSTDAIIPMWTYMLVATYATPHAAHIVQCAPDQAVEMVFTQQIAAMNIAAYEGARMVIKGCSDKPVPSSAYLAITQRLQPIARSIMFGEPCSTVPVYKRAAAVAEAAD
jgi:Protein of unknown function (DUF2480)